MSDYPIENPSEADIAKLDAAFDAAYEAVMADVELSMIADLAPGAAQAICREHQIEAQQLNNLAPGVAAPKSCPPSGPGQSHQPAPGVTLQQRCRTLAQHWRTLANVHHMIGGNVGNANADSLLACAEALERLLK